MPLVRLGLILRVMTTKLSHSASPESAPHAVKGAAAGGERVGVLLPLALSGAYDYLVPEGLRLTPGDYVTVPLGPRLMVGVVWGPGSGEVADKKLKKVADRLDVPPMPEGLRKFTEWVADYTLSPPGMVLRLAMRAPGALEPPRLRTAYRLAEGGEAVLPKMTPARTRVLEVARDGFARRSGELAEEAGVSAGVVKGLADAGVLEKVAFTTERGFDAPDLEAPRPSLSPAQSDAAGAIGARVEEGGFETFLLDGVTGSGKTEVYFDAAARALSAGRQVLILLPEIALTSQFLDRFEARFGCRPAEWHSDLPARERRRVWRGVAEGRARIVVGARSALFLPFAELGLIVVDEEHEIAFKQDEGVHYNARDMAVVRGSLGAFPVVLASATPALETMANVWAGRYQHLVLSERHGAAQMPDVFAIDMRADPPERGRWLSPGLVKSMAQVLARQEQSLLFLNRRGYAPLTLCRSCGHRLECPQCDSWLVEHRFRKELACHHCGYTAPSPKACPACGAEDALVACGPGVERIAEEVTELFPEARVALLSSDVLRGPAAYREAVRQIEEHEVDIIIGTQVVAKGHNFPLLTLVGVVDADLGLENGDLRAAERTFQLLHQVSGRAGRAEKPGRVLMQTYMPEHGVMRALLSGDRDAFLEREAAGRERLGYPPYGRLAGIVLSSPRLDQLQALARDMARLAPLSEKIDVLGPAPAPLALLRGRHRMRFLVKARREAHIQGYIAQWLAQVQVPAAVRVAVDIDPYNFS